MIQEYRFGGVKVPHVDSHLKALKINWIRRIHHGDQKWVKLFHYITDMTGSTIMGPKTYFKGKKDINFS